MFLNISICNHQQRKHVNVFSITNNLEFNEKCSISCALCMFDYLQQREII